MHTSVDSAGWTGIAALTQTERSGDLTFAVSTFRLRRHRAFALGAAVFGASVCIWQASLIGRAAFELSKGPLAAAFVGSLISALSIIVWQWLTQRLKNAHLSAPLHLRADDLAMGTPSQRIAFKDIGSIKQAVPRSAFDLLATMIYRPALTFGVLRTISLYQIKLKSSAAPILLDLDVLGGTPEKIREIMDYRIQHAKP